MLISMKYDQSLAIPAPVCDGRLSIPGVGTDHSVRFHLDTGAEWTCIPRACFEILGDIGAYKPVTLIGFNGSRETQDARYVELEIEKGVQANVYVVAIDGDTGLLGRDFVNAIELQLRGSKLEWDIIC